MSMPARVFRCVLVIVAWTITSFLCHYLAKQFLQSTSDGNDIRGSFISSLAITIVQMLFCVYLTNAINNEDARNQTDRMMQLTHALATLATNFSMATTHASSTFAIKLMEPITGAVAQRIVLGNKLTFLQYTSLPIIVIGSLMFAEDFAIGFRISLGSILAFASNILLAIRNVILKQQHLADKPLTLQQPTNCIPLINVCVMVLLGSVILTDRGLLPPSSVSAIFFAVLSAFFHVAYSYISTAIVLRQLSVVGHAIGNIFKRMFVVGLLFFTGSRAATKENFYGLMLCTLGLIMYAASRVQRKQDIENTYIGKLCGAARRFVPLLVAVAVICAINIAGNPATLDRAKISRNTPGTYLVQNLSFDTTGQVAKLPSYAIPDVTIPSIPLADALAVDLVDNPELSDAISPYLAKRRDVIAEAQRIHVNIFKKLLAGRRKAMLFHYSPSENKGDSAIAVGEFAFLRKLNVDVIFHCPLGSCTKLMNTSLAIKGNLATDELVIFFHGGGNVVGYSIADVWRHEVIKAYPDFDIIMFPQSIYLNGSKNHIDFCKKTYASHKSLTFLWRDRGSYKLGKEMFPKVTSLLSPDIAFQIGPIPRTMAPSFDVMWLKRVDVESPGYEQPKKMQGLSFHVFDWLKWPTPKGTGPMENVYLMTQIGLNFLQRGRIVITDRLHGHILCILLDIPHIFIDNKEHKLSNYHNTWTRGVENIVYTNSSEDAVKQAIIMIKKLGQILPPVDGYFNRTA